MKQRMMVLGLTLIAGCARPDKERTYPSPVPGLFYTVEKYRASVPVSDTDRVVAHFESNGRSGEIVVLEGGDMTVEDLRWKGPNEATLCIRGGITTTFRNQVTIFAGESSRTVRNHLDENCTDNTQAATSSSLVPSQTAK